MNQKPSLLFLCTGNSARSQMAEALLRKHAGDRFDVFSAGTQPQGVNPLTLKVLQEADLPTAGLRSKSVAELGQLSLTWLIVVCGDAEGNCPATAVTAEHRLFWPFTDPATAKGSEAARLTVFRWIRDQIEAKIKNWLLTIE